MKTLMQVTTGLPVEHDRRGSLTQVTYLSVNLSSIVPAFLTFYSHGFEPVGRVCLYIHRGP